MGHAHPTTSRSGSARGGRLGWRKCLRKGCGRKFQARRPKDHFCRQPDCERELERWRRAKRRRQAAQRQRKHRAKPGAREKHAAAERQRRAMARQQLQGPAARAAAAEACAWSRRARLPEIFCDRPGCYDPPRPGSHACYCGPACVAAMRQAQDRERKCLRRNSEPGRFQRAQEYQKARVKRRQAPAAVAGSAGSFPVADRSPQAVLRLERNADRAVDWRGPREVKNHDPKTSAGPRPRAPPAP
jgi:hypothetical protein